jgi:hypothetical protein
MSGQPNVPGYLIFDVTKLEVEEQTGTTTFEPSTIIPRDATFKLSANFKIGETFGKGMNDLTTSAGQVFEYNISYYAQMIGGNQSYKWQPPALTCVTDTYEYKAPQTSFTVNPNTMAVGNYKLTCTVKMSPVGGGSTGFPWHVTGFVDGPMIEIYEP